MKKMFMGIVLLVTLAHRGFGREMEQIKWQVGFNGGYFIYGGDLAANSFGINIRSTSDRSNHVDEIAFNYWNNWHDGNALYTLHLSRLFRITRTSAVGVFIGPGISFFLRWPIPIPHLKSALVIPLNKSIGIDLGVIVPFIFISMPGIHAGFYVRL